MTKIKLDNVIGNGEAYKVDFDKPLERLAIRWGGAAGDGLQSTGLLIAKYFNSQGYSVHGVPGNQSSIRGGHIWYHIEIGSDKVQNYDNWTDILVALNELTVEEHLDDLKTDGILLYNNSKRFSLDPYQKDLDKKNITAIGMPFTNIAREIDLKKPVLGNTVAVGALLEMMQLPSEPYLEVLKKRFPKGSIYELNKEALKRGREAYKELTNWKISLAEPTYSVKDGIVVNGNHAIALGAAAAGLKFLAQYPITPASSILTYLANNAKKFGIVVRQVEDEISAIASVVGAGWAGVRAMTATSGPGISLMAENIGLAGITETPLVVVDAMRGGPSTGVPTKTEQGDLIPVINVSHGEFPRAVFAPRNIDEAYTLTVKAFNISEKYQLPVFILSDFGLSERLENVAPFDFDVEIDRGKIWEGPTDEMPEYHRYAHTEDGISPRLFPPAPEGIHVGVGAEHDIDSHSMAGHKAGLKSARVEKVKQFDKRFKKLEKLANEDMDPPTWDGPEDAEFTLVCWGSVYTAVLDTITRLNKFSSAKWNILSFSDMFPLPVEKVKRELGKIKKGIIVEANYTGQLEQLLWTYTGWRPHGSIRHIDGEILTATRIISFLRKMEINDSQMEDLYSIPLREWNEDPRIVINLPSAPLS